jgi:predicted Zn-dependent protease
MTLYAINRAAPLKLAQPATSGLIDKGQALIHSLKMKVEACLNRVLPRNPVTHRREIRLLPESFEKTLGAHLYPSMINSQGGYSKNQTYTDLVQKVGGHISQHAVRTLPWQFSVIKSNVLNAWCLPGGKIAFYEGLIAKMENENSDFGLGKQFSLEEKIAAVMGHEFEHGEIGHSAKSMEFAAFIAVSLKAFQVALMVFADRIDAQGRSSHPNARLASLIAKVVSVIIGRSFKLIHGMITSHGTRCRELEADRYGMLRMQQAGYDPRAAIWLQKFFVNEHPKGNTWLDKVVLLFRSHPYSEDRVRANEKTLQELQNGTFK